MLDGRKTPAAYFDCPCYQHGLCHIFLNLSIAIALGIIMIFITVFYIIGLARIFASNMAPAVVSFIVFLTNKEAVLEFVLELLTR